jgi:hypothetical protein
VAQLGELESNLVNAPDVHPSLGLRVPVDKYLITCEDSLVWLPVKILSQVYLLDCLQNPSMATGCPREGLDYGHKCNCSFIVS